MTKLALHCLAVVGVVLSAVLPAGAEAQTRVIADGFDDAVAVVALPGGEALVGERWGALWRIDPDYGTRRLRGGPRMARGGSEGLLDLAVEGGDARTLDIFFSYAKPRGMGGTVTALARGTLSRADDAVFDTTDIFTQRRVVDRAARHGGHIARTRDALWVAFGDRGDSVEPSDPATAIGSLLRLRPEGSVPVSDTPASLPATSRDGTWAFGLRDPRAVLTDATGVAHVLERRGAEMVLVRATPGGDLSKAVPLARWPAEAGLASATADGGGEMLIARDGRVARLAIVSGRIVERSDVLGPRRPVDIAVANPGTALVLTRNALHLVRTD